MTTHTVQQLRRLIACALVAMVGSLCLSLAGCESREAVATANGSARAEMRVGGFQQITGTGFLMASAYAKKEFGVHKMTIPEQRVARWIYIEVIKSDTNNNGKWDHEDRKAIAIVAPSGANYVEVITETDEILKRTMHTEDKLTVVYQSNAKHFIANIDLPQRQVTTKDLPAIP